MATTAASLGRGWTLPLASRPGAPPEAIRLACLLEPPSQPFVQDSRRGAGRLLPGKEGRLFMLPPVEIRIGVGPSPPDFLCVFSTDNGICRHTNRRLRGSGGLRGRGLAQLREGWGTRPPGASESNPEAARDQALADHSPAPDPGTGWSRV